MTDTYRKEATVSEIERLNAETELLRARHAHDRARRLLREDEPWFMNRWWTPWVLTFGAMALTAIFIKAFA